jgi:hypothetical protein
MGNTIDWISSRLLWETIKNINSEFTHQQLLADLDAYYKSVFKMCTCHFSDFDRTFDGGTKIYRIKKIHLKTYLEDRYPWLLGVWF